MQQPGEARDRIGRHRCTSRTPEKALHEAIVVCDYWGMRRVRLSKAALIGSTALVAGLVVAWPSTPHPPQEPCLAG
jgi:hypothetical protein